MDQRRLAGLLVLCGLAACGGSDVHGPGVSCTQALPAQRVLQGTVTEVQDGDTLTLDGTHRVRLVGIDAPELSQDYGGQSRAALRALVEGHAVSITYSETDRYGRLLGQVFASGCTDVNLRQVQTGAAWFYRAYQCDLGPAQRQALDAAERLAHAARHGLWADALPVAPWVFRNGTEPEVPVCAAS